MSDQSKEHCQFLSVHDNQIVETIISISIKRDISHEDYSNKREPMIYSGKYKWAPT